MLITGIVSMIILSVVYIIQDCISLQMLSLDVVIVYVLPYKLPLVIKTSLFV